MEFLWLNTGQVPLRSYSAPKILTKCLITMRYPAFTLSRTSESQAQQPVTRASSPPRPSTKSNPFKCGRWIAKDTLVTSLVIMELLTFLIESNHLASIAVSKRSRFSSNIKQVIVSWNLLSLCMTTIPVPSMIFRKSYLSRSLASEIAFRLCKAAILKCEGITIKM